MMKITITFVPMPGAVQVESVTLRIDTDDLALAVSQSTEFVKTFTTVEIASVLLVR